MERFRGGLVFKAYRLLYQSTLGLRVIKKKMGRTTTKQKSDEKRVLEIPPHGGPQLSFQKSTRPEEIDFTANSGHVTPRFWVQLWGAPRRGSRATRRGSGASPRVRTRTRCSLESPGSAESAERNRYAPVQIPVTCRDSGTQVAVGG